MPADGFASQTDELMVPSGSVASAVCRWLNALDDADPDLLIRSRWCDGAWTEAIDPFGERAWFVLSDGWVVGPDEDGCWVVLGPAQLFPRWSDVSH